MLEEKQLTKSQLKFLKRMRRYMYEEDINTLEKHMQKGVRFIHGADIMDDILIVDKKYKAYRFRLKKNN